MSKKKCRSSIGGQAVLEGVMMLGEKSMATAVRDDKGNIQVESKRIKPMRERSVFRRIPFIRGVFNFCSTMYMGVGIIMRSSEVYGDDIEPGRFEKWCARKMKLNVYSIMMVVSVVIGLALAIGLFFVLPHFVIEGIKALVPEGVFVHEMWYNLIEGVIRILIFVGYIALTSLMKDIRRVYMYHGAEHKTISCFENGLDLTVENVQKQSTIHDRCGTTFMFLVMIISVLVFSLVSFGIELNMWLKLLIKLALLPVVAGVSYEILKFLARFDNAFVRIIKAPGLALQKLTTRQPDDSMVEVAIEAFTTVYDMDRDETIPETTFDTKLLYRKVRDEMDTVLGKLGEGNADVDWIICEVLGVKRSELQNVSHVRISERNTMMAMARKRAEGIPLQQILGNTDFYGITIRVTDKVLCPRPETEYLTEECIKLINSDKIPRVLDLCTGSGAIAIAIAKNCIDTEVFASDISDDALEIARENKSLTGVKIEIIESDLFEKIEGKFGLIVSNPPYIPTEEIGTLAPEVKDHEPVIALDGGEDGLDFYRKIVQKSPHYLDNGGYLALEVGIGQAQSLKDMMEQDFTEIRIVKDLEGIDRIIIGRLKNV